MGPINKVFSSSRAQVAHSRRRSIPAPTDVLGEALYQLRLDGSLYCQSELTEPWGIEMPEFPGNMMFHIVTEGECWLQAQGMEPILLNAGSFALLPHGKGHIISANLDSKATPLFDIDVEKLNDRYEIMAFGGEGSLTRLTCGVISFNHAVGLKLLAELPRIVHIQQFASEHDQWIRHTLEFIAREAQQPNIGGETIMAHLADILVIHAIRHWVSNSKEAGKGWLGALQDPKIGRALLAVHCTPAHDWSVASLAREAGMSRSGFSARFTQIVGTSVKQYLTEWRMSIAKTKLMNSSITLGELSESLGYQSEAAFSRAYKRVMGVSPMRG